MEAVLEDLRTTRLGCLGAEKVPPEDRGAVSDGAKGGPGPSLFVFFLRLSFVSSFLLLRHCLRAKAVFLFPLSFLSGGWGPYYDRLGRSGARETVTYI